MISDLIFAVIAYIEHRPLVKGSPKKAKPQPVEKLGGENNNHDLDIVKAPEQVAEAHTPVEANYGMSSGNQSSMRHSRVSSVIHLRPETS